LFKNNILKNKSEEKVLNQQQETVRLIHLLLITMGRRGGMDPSVVAELVGHEHQSTTDKYYNKIEIKQMRDELEKFKPSFL
jgi:integrase